MLVYPQLSSGALGQFPMVKRRTARTIVNCAADGSSVKIGDPGGAITQWQLSYAGLSDAELAALQQFFLSTEGSLNGFTFVDPTANLLAWSEALNDSVWSADPFVTLQSGIADPGGGTRAWQLSNTGAGPQALTQTLNAPAGYSYCFSVYAQAVQPVAIALKAGNTQAIWTAGTAWTRFTAVGGGAANGESIAAAIVIPAGASVNVFGPQVEAQGVASAYQTSTLGGVYENARFRDDILSFTTQAVNRHSVTVNILYANHL